MGLISRVSSRTYRKLKAQYDSTIMKLTNAVLILMIVTMMNFYQVDAGPITYGICQTACNAAYASCQASRSSTVVAFRSASLVALPNCSAAQAACMAACETFFSTP